MFRFSISSDTPVDTNAEQLATAGITPDADYAQRLRQTGEARDGETVYRVENVKPDSFADAIAYVQGVFHHAPRRIWIDDEGYDVTADDLENVEPPTA